MSLHVKILRFDLLVNASSGFNSMDEINLFSLNTRGIGMGVHTKSLYISHAVSNSYGAEIEI